MAFIATSNNTAQTRDIDTLIRSPTITTPSSRQLWQQTLI